jgi:hypothetical protein
MSIDLGPQGNRVPHSQYSSSLTSHRPDEAAQHSFGCHTKRGAILSLPMPAQRKDTTARGAFAKCIIKHVDEWFAFAQERDLGINREDIILVTGCHLARTWATMALQGRGEQIAFGAFLYQQTSFQPQSSSPACSRVLSVFDLLDLVSGTAVHTPLSVPLFRLFPPLAFPAGPDTFSQRYFTTKVSSNRF